MAKESKEQILTADAQAEADISKVAPEDYNKVVDVARLVAVNLSNLVFDVQPEQYDRAIKKRLHFERGVTSCRYDSEDKAVIGTFRFSVFSKASRKKCLSGAADYVVVYGLSGDIVEEAAISYCKRVGMFAAYPYFRAMMANLAWSSDAKLPPLPSIATRGMPVKAANPA